VHNAQPWRFVWDGEALTVSEDPSRALASLDVTGRERVLSVGAAVGFARLAFRSAGVECRVEILPDPERPEIVARLVPEGAAAEDARSAELVAVISSRYTERGVFGREPVASDAVARLVEAAESEGAWLRVLETAEDRVALSVLLSHADAAESADPEYQAELARWRTSEPESEGIPDAAVAGPAPADRASDFALRDFSPENRRERAGSVDDDAPPPVPERALAVVLGTPFDDRRDWVVAGMALGRVLLQATVDGLAAQPMTQVVEVPAARARLRQELRLLGVPQVVLRVGHGSGARATRRRPVDDVLETRSPD